MRNILTAVYRSRNGLLHISRRQNRQHACVVYSSAYSEALTTDMVSEEFVNIACFCSAALCLSMYEYLASFCKHMCMRVGGQDLKFLTVELAFAEVVCNTDLLLPRLSS